jgi:pimeloyl-ACP methyl ester carboxylesterase
MEVHMKRFLRLLLLLAALFVPTHQAFAAAPPTQYLQLARGTIAYDDTGGEGPVVIALPGMGEMRAQYRFLRPMFAQEGIRLVTMDPRGQGESSVHWADYSTRATARDIRALIHRLKARRVILVGNSFSAGSVLLAAHEAGDKVGGVVLIGPVVQDPPASRVMGAAISLAFSGPWATRLWMHYWDSLFPSRHPADFEGYRAALRANLEQPGRMDVLRKLFDVPKSEAAGVIGSLRLPSLVVMGERDNDFESPETTARQLAQRLGSELVIVAGAGHYPHVEFPEVVVPRIVRFARLASEGVPLRSPASRVSAAAARTPQAAGTTRRTPA